MMENQAIKIIKQEKQWESNARISDAFEMAIKALEKQVPKKPIDVSRLSDGFGLVGRCPNCSGIIDDSYIYCDDCGQKLDWEGGE